MITWYPFHLRSISKIWWTSVMIGLPMKLFFFYLSVYAWNHRLVWSSKFWVVSSYPGLSSLNVEHDNAI